MTASLISPGPLAELLITPSDIARPPVGKSFIVAFVLYSVAANLIGTPPGSPSPGTRTSRGSAPAVSSS